MLDNNRNNAYIAQLQQVRRKLETVMATLDKCETTAATTTATDNSAVYDAVFLAEKACIQLRKLPLYCNLCAKNTEVQRQIDDRTLQAHEIIVDVLDGCPYVKIPRLLPSRNLKDKGVEFVRAPLQAALKQYVEENGYPEKSKQRSTLVIRHEYPQTQPEYCRRDHDNYELKGIIDDISTCFLYDDSITYCDRLYLSKPGSSFSTEMFVVPSAHLVAWLEKNHE